MLSLYMKFAYLIIAICNLSILQAPHQFVGVTVQTTEVRVRTPESMLEAKLVGVSLVTLGIGPRGIELGIISISAADINLSCRDPGLRREEPRVGDIALLEQSLARQSVIEISKEAQIKERAISIHKEIDEKNARFLDNEQQLSILIVVQAVEETRYQSAIVELELLEALPVQSQEEIDLAKRRSRSTYADFASRKVYVKTYQDSSKTQSQEIEQLMKQLLELELALEKAREEQIESDAKLVGLAKTQAEQIAVTQAVEKRLKEELIEVIGKGMRQASIKIDIVKKTIKMSEQIVKELDKLHKEEERRGKKALSDERIILVESFTRQAQKKLAEIQEVEVFKSQELDALRLREIELEQALVMTLLQKEVSDIQLKSVIIRLLISSSKEIESKFQELQEIEKKLSKNISDLIEAKQKVAQEIEQITNELSEITMQLKALKDQQIQLARRELKQGDSQEEKIRASQIAITLLQLEALDVISEKRQQVIINTGRLERLNQLSEERLKELKVLYKKLKKDSLAKLEILQRHPLIELTI